MPFQWAQAGERAPDEVDALLKKLALDIESERYDVINALAKNGSQAAIDALLSYLANAANTWQSPVDLLGWQATGLEIDPPGWA